MGWERIKGNETGADNYESKKLITNLEALEKNLASTKITSGVFYFQRALTFFGWLPWKIVFVKTEKVLKVFSRSMKNERKFYLQPFGKSSQSFTVSKNQWHAIFSSK